jgi:hypothetical protein
MDAKGKKSAKTAASQTNESSGRNPIWDDTSERVKCAIWKHDQKGRSRYTVALYRSYRDEGGSWHNVHFFDRNDLKDVTLLAERAAKHIDGLHGLEA